MLNYLSLKAWMTYAVFKTFGFLRKCEDNKDLTTQILDICCYVLAKQNEPSKAGNVAG